jgi:FtsH-binding integral membrane protein
MRRTVKPGQAGTTLRGNSMSDFDRNIAARSGYRADQVAIDAGLRAYMIRVYNYMASGVALTGLASWLTYQAAGGDAIHIANGGIVGATAFGLLVLNPLTQIILAVGTFGMVWYISARINRLETGTALMLFMVYAALLGLFLAPIFLQYTQASITRVFFISAASFGALSLYGYTTQRDLSPIGAFLIMGLFGLLGAILVQFVLGLFGIHSSAFTFLISVVGVLIFAGLTAYDTQRIKEMYSAMDDGTVAGRKAVMGALSLYLDFINLFLFMLRLLGDRR